MLLLFLLPLEPHTLINSISLHQTLPVEPKTILIMTLVDFTRPLALNAARCHVYGQTVALATSVSLVSLALDIVLDDSHVCEIRRPHPSDTNFDKVKSEL